ncbi:MAG TPA: DMT family transporter [Spirochaetota bacterium]|nr:DMT family transporter [Spirochaetota bacterium]
MNHMKNLSQETIGEVFNLGAMLLWGMMPVLVRSSSGIVPPLFFSGSSIFLAGLVCFFVLMVQKKIGEIFCAAAFRDMMMSTLIISVLFYGVLFFAGQKTSAGNIAIIGQSEVVWTFMFFTLLGFEKLTLKKTLGAAVVVCGVLMIVIKSFSGDFVVWDFVLLLVFAITPLGNYFQKRALKRVSSITQLCFRSLVGGSLSLIASLIFERGHFTEASAVPIVVLVLLNGILALGLSKIMFLESLKRLEVSKTIAMGAAAPAVTMTAAYFILNEKPDILQLLGLALVVLGILVMINKSRSIRL